MKPLERQNFRQQHKLGECVACGGKGTSSRGRTCLPCGGTGGQGGALVLAELSTSIVQHSSDSNEHYTPPEIVEAARKVLGHIDLDPASCPMAQEVVKAVAWYGPGSPFGEDGLAEPGAGRVFLNPPGGLVPDEYAGLGTRSNAALWWAVWSNMWLVGEIDAMIFIGFTLEILRSTQGLDCPQPLDFPLCVPSSRIDFETENTVRTKGKKAGELIDPNEPEGARVSQGSPGHANVIVYLPPAREDSPVVWSGDENLWTGEDVARFREAFAGIGRCRT